MTERRVVEFGDTRYEFVGGVWWWRQGDAMFDATPQERALVEELERQQAGMRQLLAERERLRAELKRAETKVALLTGAMILDTGKSPVWPDDNTLAWEQVGPTPRRDEADQ